MDPFVHLRAVSGYSLRHGTVSPDVLAQAGADLEMDALALTDRDGLYGAVKFATACQRRGVRPIFGVSLAVSDELSSSTANPARRSPARGGRYAPEPASRVTLLATDGAGWASLCRLVTAAHLAGERGSPVADVAMIAQHLDGLLLLLGDESIVARAAAARRPDRARTALQRWREVCPDSALVGDVVCHRGDGQVAAAGRYLSFLTDERITSVVTNAVRYLSPAEAPVADVLDAVRRLVPLDARHVDRVNAQGYLKSGKEMADVADEVVCAAGLPAREAARLLARTRMVADRCAVPVGAGGLGIGQVHFPSFEVDGKVVSVDLAQAALRDRCEAGIGRRGLVAGAALRARLDEELAVIAHLGYPSYFHTVADVTDMIRTMGIRVAARGSAAGSLVTFLLGISDVDPLEHGLVMERFLSPLRRELPDIDIDVESARRMEIYDAVFDRFGGERCACVSMMDTYRVRHAIRDVGAALGLPPGEIDTVAKAFPHIRARGLRAALRDLPELRESGLGGPDGRGGRFETLFTLAEALDGLPRHIAVHPCGVLLSDVGLLGRTPVEASWWGYPMSQFDKEDVEVLGMLKLDILGVRMQSAIAFALEEIERVDGARVEIDGAARDDPATFELIRSTKTLGCFQIESPGQRELLGKFAPETFGDIIIDISLFRPGPVKSDMVTPFLSSRQGWSEPVFPHPDLAPVLAETCGVVVFHEQVLSMIAVLTGCTLAEADEARRRLGNPDTQEPVRTWFVPAALARGYSPDVVDQCWQILHAFASFGFCKAHAAAFAVPTYQSAFLKAHHPAAFLAGVLTHDPGMYPKRLILDDARQWGIAVLPLDVNRSDDVYRVERVGRCDEPPPAILGADPRPAPEPGLPDGRDYGIRLSLADVKGISQTEIAAILAARPFHSLADFHHRTGVSRPIIERLVLAGAFDEMYSITTTIPGRRRGRLTRRDLLLSVADLASAGLMPRRRRAVAAAVDASAPVWERTGAQAQGAVPVDPANLGAQLAFDWSDQVLPRPSGLMEMTQSEQIHAELEILGLDASAHVLAGYEPFLTAIGATRARDLVRTRSEADVVVAGVKVATQTPPIRSGRRVVFVTLDDATGPADATFFEDAQAGYAATVFHSWLLLVRGHVRRTGPRGVSLRATGAWDLSALREAWESGGMPAVRALMRRPTVLDETAMQAAAASRSTRPVMEPVVGGRQREFASGFKVSPYADVRPAGTSTPPRKLWHSSPGSSGG